MSETQTTAGTRVDAEFIPNSLPEENSSKFVGEVHPVEVAKATLELDTDEIYVDESQNMRRYPVTAKAIHDLAEDILSIGQLQPVMVRKTDSGKYTLVFGFSRVRAIQHINEQKLSKTPMKVLALNAGVGMSDLEAYSANVAENLKRQDLSPIDQVHIIKTFTDGGMSKSQVAKLLRRAPSWVTSHAQIGELRPKIQRMIHEGKIPYTYAVELVGLSEEEQDKAIEELESGKGGSEETREKLRKKRKAKKAAKKGEDVTFSLTLKELRKEFQTMAGLDLEEGADCKFSENAQLVGAALLKFMDGKLGIRALANKIDAL